MITLFQSLHFLRPQWFLALIPLAMILILLALTHHKKTNWQTVCDQHLLDQLLVLGDKTRQVWPLVLLALGWLFAIIALTGPSWTQKEQIVYQNLKSRMIVLDLSPAMNASDVEPSRIARARYKIDDLLKQNREGQVGLIVFADEPFIVSPLTQDAKTITAMVPNLSTEIMPVEGQNISRALKFAVKTMQQAHVEAGNIILITPGPVTPADIATAKELQTKGFHLSVLGIGSVEGAPLKQEQGNFIANEKGDIILSKLDRAGLQNLAEAGNGQYVDFSHRNDDIKALSKENLPDRFKNQTTTSKQKSERWQDNGYWFALFIVPLALIGFRRGWFG